MNKLIILIQQVYLQKIRSKSFILLSLVYIVVISCIMFWSEIRSLFSSDDYIKVAIINDTTIEVNEIFTSSDDIEFIFSSEDEEVLFEQVIDGQLQAVVTLSEQNKNLLANIATYLPLSLNEQSTISSLIQYAGKVYAIQQLNLTVEDAERILHSEATIITTNLNETIAEGKSEDEKLSGIIASYFVGIIIYFFVTTYLSMVTTDVASEKGSRTLEMLLVSVKPSIHFQSKIFGIILVAISQFILIFGTLLILLRLIDNGSKLEIIASVLQDISYAYVLFVIVFLFLTIFLYLIIGALFGSLVSKVEEASQVMTPTIMITLIGFYVMLSGMFNPDTLLIKVFSYIPLTSGMVMPLRIGATDISLIEPMISLLLLIITVIIAYWISLSFYKRSVLTYSSGNLVGKIKAVLKFTT